MLFLSFKCKKIVKRYKHRKKEKVYNLYSLLKCYTMLQQVKTGFIIYIFILFSQACR